MKDDIIDRPRANRKALKRARPVTGRTVRRQARPARRAAKARLARRALAGARPLPQAPARRVSSVRPRAAAPVDPEAQVQLQAIEGRLAKMEADVQMEGAYAAIGRIEASLTQLPLDLDALRDRAYVHSGQLEDRLAALDEQWDTVMPRLEDELRKQIDTLNRGLDQAERKVTLAATGRTAAISAANSAVDRLERRIGAASDALRSQYESLESELSAIEFEIRRREWMVDQIEQSPNIRLRETEGPLVAVEAAWHRNGDEGPKGVLFLTDQRLLFEQREEIVTKKRFGIFKAETEEIRELHLDIEVHDVESVEHNEEGGFLGLGKADILELTCSGQAPISRARFHLKGQDSSEWAALIKRVQTGDIDADRADEYIQELAQATAASGTFPAQCPNCLAAVPEPPRGTDRVTCEYCGGIIRPEETN